MSGLLINKNFVKSILASGITNVAVSLSLQAGDGAKFPATGDFVCVIWSAAYASPVSDATREIIKVTARSTDALTIVRAQEGTSNKAWNANDNIALVITAGKIGELETELGYAAIGRNLLQNASFAIWDGVSTNAPAGWTISGASAAVSVAAGTYGYRAITLTAGAGATAKLTQILPANLPKISGDYGIAAFACVSSGGSGKLNFGALQVPVTNTTPVVLKQGTGSVSAWNFEIEIDASKSITVEMPTVVLGKTLPYPMYGGWELSGQHSLGHPGRGKDVGQLADGASLTFNISGLALSGVDTAMGLVVYYISLTNGYGGVMRAVHYKASGGSFKGPVVYTEGAKSSSSDASPYVCLFGNSNVLTLKNRLGGGEAIRYVVEYIWG